jgi:endonuclease/exonuclease/phosphatase family metal-dependent hydrolase
VNLCETVSGLSHRAPERAQECVMQITARRFLPSLAVLLAILAGTASAKPRTNDLVFRVVSFNIRFDFPSDQAAGNQWANRPGLVAGLVKDAKASVVCFQEDKHEQVADLKKVMPGWDFYGMGRDGRASEGCSIAYKTDEWRCVDKGDLWLSDTPEKVASNTWGCKYPHKVTWATLESLHDVKHRSVTFMSTHLDEHGDMDEVRRKSALVIRNWIAKNRPTHNVVVCGDFNASTDSSAHKVLADPQAKPHLLDAFEATNSRDAHAGTVHNFTGKAGSKRIDWIFTGGAVSPRDARVERWNKDGRYPSDHFAVSAELEVGVDAKKPAGKAEPKEDAPKPEAGKVEPQGSSGGPPQAEAPKPETPPSGSTPDGPPPSEPGLSPLDPEPAKPKK